MPRDEGFKLPPKRDDTQPVFKASAADMSVVRDVLDEAFQDRICLYGAPTRIVSEHLTSYITEKFSKEHRSHLKKIIRPGIRPQEFIPMLITQCRDYVLAFTDEQVKELLFKEIKVAATERSLKRLLPHLSSCVLKGDEILCSSGISVIERSYFHSKWAFMLEHADKQRSFIERLPIRVSFPDISWGFLGKAIVSIVAGVGLSRINSLPFIQLSPVMQKVRNIVLAVVLAKSLRRFVPKTINVRPLTEDFKTFVSRGCHDYLSQHHEYPLIAEIISACPLPSSSPALVADVKHTVIEAPPKVPKRRDTTQVASEAVPVKKEEKQMTNRIIQDEKGSTYFMLEGYKEGTFYRHNSRQQSERLGSKSGQEGLLFAAIKTILTKDSTVHSETHRESGLKRLGESEKKEFPNCSMKIRFNGRKFGKLRIGVGPRPPTAAEVKLLGNCQEINSPRVLRTK